MEEKSLEERIEDLEDKVEELQSILVIYGIAVYDEEDDDEKKPRIYS